MWISCSRWAGQGRARHVPAFLGVLLVFVQLPHELVVLDALNSTTLLSMQSQTMHLNVRKSLSLSNFDKRISHIGLPHVGQGGCSSGFGGGSASE